jgi:hypothetical protein
MWNNSTEGGEVPELYYLKQGLQESVFPQAVCKYYLEGGHDAECPGLEAARAAGNPLKFTVSVRRLMIPLSTAASRLILCADRSP